uniref:Uncharacterized protein n=1 Tax=Anguilla anguilla TaxID=7936 RepID=A0A0E9SGC5_ANGAN
MLTTFDELISNIFYHHSRNTPPFLSPHRNGECLVVK